MKIYALVAAAGLFLVVGIIWKGQRNVSDSLENIKVRIGTAKVLPDPTKIETTGDWYFLDHISSGLVSYDFDKGSFTPNIASGWEITKDREHIFKIRKDLNFNDGSPITIEDIVASLKRVLIKKTSTHLPLWNYIEGCANLKSVDDDCPGLRVTKEGDLSITLITKSESFFLQLASPETGLWAKVDIAEDLSLKPTKFSGPYAIEKSTELGFLLKRNEESLISKKFPQSPRTIDLVSIPMTKAEEDLNTGKIDLLLRSHNPFAESDRSSFGVNVYKTAPATIVYLHSVHNNESIKLVGQDFIQKLWAVKTDEAIAADTFLPFANKYSLTKPEFLNALPKTSAKKIRVGKPWNFYSDKFISTIKDAAKASGIDIEMVHLEPSEWSAAFENPKAKDKIDFILTPYVASERYPAVQLRFLTGRNKKSPIDLIEAESPDLTPKKISVLKDYQKWMLESQSAVPLFFTRMHLYHRDHIDLGSQSLTDGEVELWRLKKRLK
ncbi:MAG: ABC transporter substrate-binding protein [Patescibacteria group bacterium]